MRVHFRCPTAVATVALAATSLSLAGQVGPGTFADANAPSGAPDPGKLDLIWQVNPLSGALTVKIPFPTTPKGGRGPTIPFALLYNSMSTVALQASGTTVMDGSLGNQDVSCYAFQGSSTPPDCLLVDAGVPASSNAVITQEFQWAPAGTFGIQDQPVGPWTTTGPRIKSSNFTVSNQTYQVANGIVINLGDGCTVTGPYLYYGSEGSAHDMNLELNNAPTQNMSSPCGAAYNATVTPNPTVGGQGEGWVSFTSDGSSLLTTSIPATVTYPNGTTFSSSGLEDTNGNIASLNESGTTWTATDALARTAFSTNIPIAQEGIIPTGTYTVTTTGATGQPQEYQVVFSAEPLGTFNMPHPANSEAYVEGYCVGSITCPDNFSVTQIAAGMKVHAISSITLPNNTSYTFQYDPTYGIISKIIFPTGGYVRFVFGIRSDCGGYGSFSYLSCIVVTDAYLSDGSTGEKHWNYAFPTTSQISSTVTAPDGSYTQYQGTGFLYTIINDYKLAAAPTWKETFREMFTSSGIAVRSIATSYDAGVWPSQVATTLWDGSTPWQEEVNYSYDPYFNVVEKDESDYYSCSSPCTPPSSPGIGWLRKTFTSYQYQNNSSWTSANMVNEPSQVLITDGSGHPYSLVQYAYDQTPVGGATGYLEHDDVNYGLSSTRPRGNLTSESHCSHLNNSTTVTPSTAASACSSWLTTTRTYDLAGQMLTITDPNLYTTHYSFTDHYAEGSPAGATDGYPTTITHPSGVTDTYTYDYSSGDTASHTDWNAQTTTYTYESDLSRLTGVSLPDGGNTNINYNGDPTPPVITTTIKENSSESLVATDAFDGLGRLVTHTAPNGSLTTRVYDSLGRLQAVSNPYFSGSTTYYTSYLYDAVSRRTTECNADNGTGPDSCTPSNSYKSWGYAGNVTTFMNEDHNQWTDTLNGLGWLGKVVEPGTLTTTYGYDTLGNLITVTQTGNGSSDTPRVRTFNYDAMSRLLCASNSESANASCPFPASYSYVNATTGYTYDGDGSVSAKTDARGLSTYYQYDNMNNLIQKTYSDTQTPIACYEYGAVGASSNTRGRLINEWTQKSGTSCTGSGGTYAPVSGQYLSLRSVSSYDPMGRQASVQQQQCIGSSCSASSPYSLGFSYDLAGNTTSLTNSIGADNTPITLTYYYDSAAQPCLTTSSWSSSFSPNLFQANTSGGYTAFGGSENWYLGSTASSASTLCSAAISSNVNLTQTYFPRMWVKTFAATGQVP